MEADGIAGMGALVGRGQRIIGIDVHQPPLAGRGNGEGPAMDTIWVIGVNDITDLHWRAIEDRP